MLRTTTISVLAYAASFATATTALAQSAPTTGAEVTSLGELVVTAQRREQKLQDVGISVTAFSGEQLAALGVKSSQDLIQITPGLRNPSSGSGFTASFSLRGLSQSDFGASQEAPVALYIDDVYQSSQGASQFLLFDIDRSEVLRGPQGTLFGRNATGGLVHFITNKPTFDQGGVAQVTYGRFNAVKPELALNTPLGDTVALRVSAAGEWRDPIVTNTRGRGMSDADRYAGRVQLLWKPSDDLKVLLSGRAGRVREVGSPFLWAAARPTGFANTGELTPGLPDFFGFRNTGNGDFRVTQDPITYHHVDTKGVTGTVDWKIGDMTLTSITDFTSVKVNYAEESDMQPGEFFHYYATQNSKQFSQELRLAGDSGPVNWTVGGFYLDIDGDYRQQGRSRDYFALLGSPGVGSETAVYDVSTKSGSVFGQIEYRLSDQFRVIGGARYIRERKGQNYNVAYYDLGGSKVAFGSSPDLLNFNATDTQGLYALKAELDWKPNEDVLVYLTYNRGVKSGGFNAPLDPSGAAIFIDPATFDPAPTADAAMRFRPETLHAFELGAKTSLLNDVIRLNVAAFYYDYEDFQALNFQGVAASYITNNDATLKGVDTELYAQPIEGLNLVFGASYLDQVVHKIAIGALVVDRKIPYAPKWNLTALARYEWAAFDGKLAVQANANYVSAQELGLTNASATHQDGYALVNARFSYTFPNDKLTAALFVDNVTDQRPKLNAFDLSSSFGSIERQIGDPRTYGVNVRYKFGR